MKKHMRLFIILGIIFFAGIGWTGAWFYGADFLEEKISEVQEKLQMQNQEIQCNNQQAVGYPFRIGITCDSFSYVNARYGSQFLTSGMRSAAQLYQPGKAVVELTSPGTLQVAGNEPFDIEWSSLFSSIKAGLDGPQRFSLHGQELKISDPINGAAVSNIKDIQIHFRKHAQSDVDFILTLDDFAILAGASPKLPAFDTNLNMRFHGIYYKLIQKPDLLAIARDEGLGGELNNFRYQSVAGGIIHLTGPWQIDSAGILSANFELKVSQIGKIFETLKQLFPQLEKVLEQISGSLALLGQGSDNQELTLPLTINKGRVSIGFIPITRVPPLY